MEQNASTDLLLEEYKVISSRNINLDERIWQTASVFLPAGVVAAGFVATRPVNTITAYLTIVFFSVIGMSVLIAWWRIYERWSVLQSINSHRAREIEVTLGFWFNRYQYLIHEWQAPATQKELERLRRDDSARYDTLDAVRRRRVPGRLERMTARAWVRILLFLTALGWTGLDVAKSFDYNTCVGWSSVGIASVVWLGIAAWVACGLRRGAG